MREVGHGPVSTSRCETCSEPTPMQPGEPLDPAPAPLADPTIRRHLIASIIMALRIPALLMTRARHSCQGPPWCPLLQLPGRATCSSDPERVRRGTCL